MICILPFRLMGCESRLCDHNRFHRQSPEFDNHDNQPARWIEADSALPAGERVDNLSWSPDGSRLMFDRTHARFLPQSARGVDNRFRGRRSRHSVPQSTGIRGGMALELDYGPLRVHKPLASPPLPSHRGEPKPGFAASVLQGNSLGAIAIEQRTTLLAGRQFPFCKGRGQFPPKRSRPSQKPRQR